MRLFRISIGVPLLLILLANGDQSAFDRTLVALAAGAAVNNGDGHRLRDAGLTLLINGANPIEGEDLGKKWSKGTARVLYRDRALGPGYRAVSLNAGSVAHFEQVFFAGQRAQVALVPLANLTFQLDVTDDQGDPQCSSGLANRCAWTPIWTTRYRIAVTNKTSRSGAGYLVMQ